MNKSSPKERFSATVQDYMKYRPSYPQEIIQLLIEECSLNPESIIADVGSGTGLLSKLFLDNGNTVFGIEPNSAMREASRTCLKSYTHFYSVEGSAEETTIPSHSIDIVTVGTAFHWFDSNLSKQEFCRILKSPGWAVLIWNVRDLEHSDLLKAYEELIRHYSTDYSSSNAIKFDQTLMSEFFDPFLMKMKSFRNAQYLNWEGFKGRLLSSSFVPREDDANFAAMIAELNKIFEAYEEKGNVEFLYQTKVYYGRLK